jgi:hypothetical protein
MWTGPQKCWRVGMRNSTHVSYKLTVASVNAGRVSMRDDASKAWNEVRWLWLLDPTGKWAELGESVGCIRNHLHRDWVRSSRNRPRVYKRSRPAARLCSKHSQTSARASSGAQPDPRQRRLSQTFAITAKPICREPLPNLWLWLGLPADARLKAES